VEKHVEKMTTHFDGDTNVKNTREERSSLSDRKNHPTTLCVHERNKMTHTSMAVRRPERK